MDSLGDNNVKSMSLPLRNDYSYNEAGKEIIVQDTAKGIVHFLNPTAALVWKRCDGKTTLQECEDLLRSSFKVPATADLAADLRRILDDFAQTGLVEETGDFSD
jgi:hypothetical protein